MTFARLEVADPCAVLWVPLETRGDVEADQLIGGEVIPCPALVSGPLPHQPLAVGERIHVSRFLSRAVAVIAPKLLVTVECANPFQRPHDPLPDGFDGVVDGSVLNLLVKL